MNNQKMSDQKRPCIGILQAGQNRAELAGRFDDYPVMFERLLGTGYPDSWCTAKTFRVLDSIFPENVEACDGYIVTGSAAGVYEDHAWMQPLMTFIRTCYERKQPLLGICFGHQAVAQALGGKVMKWPDGWGVGVHTTTLHNKPAFMKTQKNQIDLIYFHQDQVTELPEGAVRLAETKFCPNAAFSIGQTIFCLQGHPEFDADYSCALLNLISDRVGKERTQAAQATLSMDTDAHSVADWVQAFFKTAIKAVPEAA